MSIETDTVANQVRFEIRSGEETGAGMQYANGQDSSPWFPVGGVPHENIFIRIQLNPVTGGHRSHYYNDSDFTIPFHRDTGTFTEVAGWGLIDPTTAFLENVLFGCYNPQDPHDGDTVRFVHFRPQNITLEYSAQYPNGTALTNCEDLTTLEAIQQCIDTVIGYPDPEDPDPPSTNPDIPRAISRFRFKMYAVIFGLCAIFLPLIAGTYYRVSLSSWVAILFVALLGYAILNYSQFM